MPFYTPQQLERIKRKVRSEKRKRFLTARGIEPPRSIEALYYQNLKKIVRKLETPGSI